MTKKNNEGNSTRVLLESSQEQEESMTQKFRFDRINVGRKEVLQLCTSVYILVKIFWGFTHSKRCFLLVTFGPNAN